MQIFQKVKSKQWNGCKTVIAIVVVIDNINVVVQIAISLQWCKVNWYLWNDVYNLHSKRIVDIN